MEYTLRGCEILSTTLKVLYVCISVWTPPLLPQYRVDFKDGVGLEDIIIHMLSPQIKEKMHGLSSSHKELKDGWEEQRVELEHNLDSQMFKRDAEQAEIWIAMRESLLGSDDIGVSLHTAYLVLCNNAH